MAAAIGSAKGRPPYARTRKMLSTNARSGCSGQRGYGGGRKAAEEVPSGVLFFVACRDNNCYLERK